ncbi:alpha-1-antiproteinase 2-like [Scyliorhinus torazame]|uniref:alpha-1-antiproteinase 2-like n=1 Tax=Scyliorhinus torazame TaxID=75743 RepID=UPI003B5B097A
MEKLIPVALLLFAVMHSGIVSVNGKPAVPNPRQQSAFKLVTANTKFALHLYRQVASQPSSAGKNIFFSPISISAALSMLSLGARASTRNQLLQGLGYSNMSQNDAAEVHETFKCLLQTLTREGSELNLTIGSALYIQQGFVVKPKFIEDAKQFYKSEAISVNFMESDKAKEQINAFVSKKTDGEIQEFIKTLETSTVMVLLNYVLFKGSWEKPFNPRSTYEADFHVDDTTTVRVQMMTKSGTYDSGYDSQLSSFVIRVPYDGNASLVLILPAAGKLAEVEQNLTITNFLHFFYSLRPSYAGLHIPKVSLKESYKLNEQLSSMGITEMFSRDADLSGISESEPLTVSKVTHEAVLHIDEKGTKAVAVTGAEITLMSAFSQPEHVFNRPFLLLIVDHNIKSVLFVGRVLNPTI